MKAWIAISVVLNVVVSVCGNDTNATVKLAVVIPWTQEWEIGPYMGAAIVLGVESVENRQLLPATWRLTWDWRDTYCKPRRGLAMAVDLWTHFDTRPSAFIGGGCSVVCEPLALLTAAWNLPCVSFGCTSETLSNKYDYPTFTRSVGTWISLAPMFVKFVEAFGWTRVAIVTTTAPVYQLTANAIKLELERYGHTVFYHTFQMVVDGDTVNSKKLLKQKEIIQDVKSKARGEYTINELCYIIQARIRGGGTWGRTAPPSASPPR